MPLTYRGLKLGVVLKVKQLMSKASCEECFFKRNNLCALDQDGGPCPTFRPNHPEGLRPPSQMRFVFRQERRTQVAYSMPSAQEQAALHAVAAM